MRDQKRFCAKVASLIKDKSRPHGGQRVVMLDFACQVGLRAHGACLLIAFVT